jgi:hypothetical protein
MNTINKTARTAGFFYLMYLITTILADLFGHLGFGDAAKIVNTMLAQEWSFRLGFVMNLLGALFFLLAAWALYALLKSVNKDLALLFLLLNLAGVAVQCFSTVTVFAGVLLLGRTDYLNVFPANQLQALAMFFVNLYKHGHIAAQLFFGAWLLPLGYLVFKSGFLPKVLGILLIVDFAGVLVWLCQFFLFPGYEVITYPGLAVSFIAEVGLTLWLLVMGAKEQKPVVAVVG